MKLYSFVYDTRKKSVERFEHEAKDDGLFYVLEDACGKLCDHIRISAIGEVKVVDKIHRTLAVALLEDDMAQAFKLFYEYYDNVAYPTALEAIAYAQQRLEKYTLEQANLYEIQNQMEQSAENAQICDEVDEQSTK